METCKNCKVDIITGANFCHICGGELLRMESSTSELLNAKLPLFNEWEMLILFNSSIAATIDAAITDTNTPFGYDNDDPQSIITQLTPQKVTTNNMETNNNYRWLIELKHGNTFRIIDGCSEKCMTQSKDALQKQERIRKHLSLITEQLFLNPMDNKLSTWDEMQKSPLFEMFNITKAHFNKPKKANTRLLKFYVPSDKLVKLTVICRSPEKLFEGFELKVKPAEIFKTFTTN
jgi:hypothetical protein